MEADTEEPRALTAVQLGTVAFAFLGMVWLATSLPTGIAGILGSIHIAAPSENFMFYVWSTTLLNLGVGTALLFGGRWLARHLFRGLDTDVVRLCPQDLTRTALLVLGLVLIVGGLTSFVHGYPPAGPYYPGLADEAYLAGAFWILLGVLLILTTRWIVRAWWGVAIQDVRMDERP